MLKFKNTPLVPLKEEDQLYPLLPTFVRAPNRPLLPASRKPGAGLRDADEKAIAAAGLLLPHPIRLRNGHGTKTEITKNQWAAEFILHALSVASPSGSKTDRHSGPSPTAYRKTQKIE